MVRLLRSNVSPAPDRFLGLGHAAGDIAHAPNQTFDGALMRTEHWTNAAETGDLAGRNAVTEGPADHVKGIPYFWSDWYGHRIQFVGTHQADAIEIIGEPGLAA